MINLSRDIKKYISVGIFFIIPIVWAISLLVLGKIVNSDFGNNFNAISYYSIFAPYVKTYYRATWTLLMPTWPKQYGLFGQYIVPKTRSPIYSDKYEYAIYYI
jgi:hypothetical protein